jgi:putative FmdB family regulatory protein
MPTYDYRCEACAHSFELFQSIKSDPVKTCPKCGEDRAQRVIGAGGGLIFKGSGFYITDYTRSKDYKEKAKGDGGGASKPSGTSGGSSTDKGTGSGSSPSTGTSGSGSGGGGSTGAKPAAA